MIMRVAYASGDKTFVLERATSCPLGSDEADVVFAALSSAIKGEFTVPGYAVCRRGIGRLSKAFDRCSRRELSE